MRHHFILAEFFQAYDELTPTNAKRTVYLRGTKVSSLGNLVRVGGIFDIYNTKITSLGKLEHVDWNVVIFQAKISSLGNLKYVGCDLDLRYTNITSLGNLKHVIGNIQCSRGEQYSKLEAENNGRFIITATL